MTKRELFENETFQALTSIAAMAIRTSSSGCYPGRMMTAMEEEVDSIDLCLATKEIQSSDIINHMDHIGFKVGEITSKPFIIKFISK